MSVTCVRPCEHDKHVDGLFTLHGHTAPANTDGVDVSPGVLHRELSDQPVDAS